jgi:hypothetical protein
MLVRVEPMTGIEPAYSAWEADVLPLNYIGTPGDPGLEKASTQVQASRRVFGTPSARMLRDFIFILSLSSRNLHQWVGT